MRPTEALRIDPSALPANGLGDLNSALRRILKSTAFELCDGGHALRLAGPDTGYHDLDPDLPAVICEFGLRDRAEVRSFRRQRDGYALCFEDSWTGYFIAGVLRAMPPRESLVLLHLDDHADMMPTLLADDGEGRLVDAATGVGFDAAAPEDWAMAIERGAIAIGSHLTPLFHHVVRRDAACHVRHLLASQPGPATVRQVRPAFHRHGLIPARTFAAVDICDGAGDSPSAGTYYGSRDTRMCLANLPAGRLVVHIDLDFFINDFNGNPGAAPLALSATEKGDVLARMDAVFRALAAVDRPVACWIIATSPGFCAARHWTWLLRGLESRIDRLHRALPAQARQHR